MAKALEELPIDAAWGQVDPLAWRSQLEPLFQKMREARSEILSTYHAQEQLKSAIERLVNRIQAEARPDRMNIREKDKRIAVEMRDRAVETTGLGAGTRSETIDLPGVDDGGEVRTLRAPSKADIPSDGNPYRVPLFQFQSSAQIDRILMPEMALEVVLKSEQTNNSTLPILAGPVDLVRSTEYIGRTTVSFMSNCDPARVSVNSYFRFNYLVLWCGDEFLFC